MIVTITTDGPAPSKTKITLEDGTPLDNVQGVDIRIRPDELVTACAQFWIGPAEFKNVPLAVTEEHLRELAAQQGFNLVKADA